jgi:hypothetical protein
MDLLRRTAMQEDMVQYDLFLVQPNLSDTQADELCLQHLVEEILAKVAPLLTRHIWQQQPFNLKYHTEKGTVLVLIWIQILLKVLSICYIN